MRQPVRRAAAAALVVALAAGCSRPEPRLTALPTPAPSVSATSDAYGPGAPGVGDEYYPTAGNGGYDVADYDLDVRYDPATRTLTGTAVITATATANLTSFDLDFTGLTTNGVTVADATASANQSGGELVITPAQPLARGTRFVTRVSYGGTPTGFTDQDLGQTGFMRTDDGAIAIGEPEVAASWFPVNDHPRDKATYTIRITAPDALAALANGVLTGKQVAQPGWTTWTWRESAPMASYLATMVVGGYRVQQSTHDGKPVVIAVDTSLSSQIDAQLARTGDIIDFLATQFGPYPFDAMGGIVVDDQRIRFALENQTRPIYSNAFFQGGDASWVIAHELAHQWYGDSVSVHDWKEIWLNEGFATYAEWLWGQHQGSTTPQRRFDQYYAQNNPAFWAIPPGDPGKGHVFDDAVYVRGGMTLQALRITVGDDAFFRILKSWAAEKANTSATTTEFIALAERISGEQLDGLFHDWLYGTTKPPMPTR